MTQPAARNEHQQAAQPSAAKRWGIPFAVVGAVVLAVITASLIGGTDDVDGTPTAPALSPIESARERCMVGEVADGGHTLVIDMRGDEYGTGSLSSSEVGCLLGALNTPASVTSRMDSTRALDGMQDASWDGLTATWTYHPDDGLDIIITDQ